MEITGSDLNPFKCGFGDFCQDDGCLENPWGNNPAPLTNLVSKYDDDGKPLNVCDECNREVIIKARILQSIGRKVAIQIGVSKLNDMRVCYKVVEA